MDTYFFKTAVHQCKDLVTITNTNGAIEYVNPSFEAHTGYLFKELEGKNISILGSDYHKTESYKRLWKLLKSGKSSSAIFLNKKKDNSLYYENRTISPIRGEDGKIHYFLFTSKDITSEFEQTIIRNNDTLILGLDSNGKIVLFNAACEALIGYSAKEITGKSFFTTLLPKNEAKARKQDFLDSLNKQKKSGKAEYSIITRSGETICIAFSNTKIAIEGSNEFHLISTGADITKERLQENKLLELNRSFDKEISGRTKNLKELNEEMLVKNKFISKINSDLPALIYLVDLQKGKVKILNKNLNSTTKFPGSVDDVVSAKYFLEYFRTTGGRKVRKDDFFLNHSTADYNLYVNTRKFYVQNKTVIFETTPNNSPSTILGFITDVTETKTTLNRLEESQKLAHIGNWEWYIHTNIVYWSDEVYKIFELDPKKIKATYKGFLKHVYNKDRKLVEDTINLSLVNKTNYEVVHRIEPRAGVIKYVIEKGYLEYDKKGHPYKMIGTSQDITETKNIKEQFDESQEVGSTGSWERILKGDRYYWSKQMYRIFDTDPKDLSITHEALNNFIYPEDRLILNTTIKTAIEKKEGYDLIYRILSSNGRLKYVNEKGSVKFLNGQAITIVGTLKDITEKRSLKNELQSAYITLQNSMNAVLTTDLRGNLQFANKAAIQLWNYPDYETMISERPAIKDYWGRGEDQKIVQSFETIYKKGSCSPAEPYIAKKRNGEKILVKFNGTLIRDERGRPYAITGSFFDVTEEIKMKREVEEYDKTLNLILANIDEVVYGIERSAGSQLDGKIFFLSGKAKEIFGFNMEDADLNPETWRQTLHPDDIEVVINSTTLAVQEKRTVTREYRMKRDIPGGYAWFEDKITPQFDSNGNLFAYFGSARDITDKRRINDLLKESEIKYRLISENNSDLISLTDPDGKLLFISNSIKQILGYEVEECMNSDSSRLWHTEYKVGSRNNPGKIQNMQEGLIPHKDGHYIWLQTFTQAILNEREEVVQVVRSSRDITERKNLEINLQASERKYRSIYENVLVGIFRTDLLTNKPIDANEVCVKLFGYNTKEDFLRNFSINERYNNPEERNILLSDLKKKKSVQNRQLLFRRKDNSLFWGNISIKLLPEENIIEGTVLDVTQNKNQEMELKKSLLEKDLLLKEVHHRVKNNLQVIISLIKLQLGRIKDPAIRGPLLESRDRIYTIALIHEKLYLGEDVATLDFSEYLQNIARPLKSLHSDKDISVKFNLEQFHTTIDIAVPLGLVCHEIISNAFKHAFVNDKKGDIYISVVNNNYTKEIIIADTGAGFNLQEIDLTKSLGWNLINNLVVQAKAKLHVRSQPGTGSIFVINLLNEE